MKNSIWVNKSFLEYSAFIGCYTHLDLMDWQQQYEIYHHAESILKNNPTDHDLACAVFQLNRAIDFREKLLNQHYNFKKYQDCKEKNNMKQCMNWKL